MDLSNKGKQPVMMCVANLWDKFDHVYNPIIDFYSTSSDYATT